MKFRYLLAKSSDDSINPKPEETLAGHARAAIEAGDAFNDVLMDDILSLLGEGFSASLWQDCLFCAIWLHDIGKANDHFQKLIRELLKYQGIRHETLAVVVVYQFLYSRLKHMGRERHHPDWFAPAILLAIAGHHLKYPDPKKNRQGNEVSFLGSHADIGGFLKIGGERFGWKDLPELENRAYSLQPFGGIEEILGKIRRELDRDFSFPVKRFIALLKSALICADIAGSALPDKIGNRDRQIRDWLIRRIRPVLQRDQLEAIVRQKLKHDLPRPFQQAVMDSDAETVLVEAGCGAGKTAAAYLWASRKADAKRLFFCYPTTATAAEGFAGYLKDPDFEAILVNSRANVDYRLLENLPQRSRSQTEFRQLKIESLEMWPIPAVVCTSHTVLGILQNMRRGITALPSLVRGAFVFDEIHAYSPRLFGHFLRFLEVFSNVPVLMMTATLPPSRKSALEAVCRGRGGFFAVKGPRERETAKRYLLSRSDEENAWLRVCQTLENGGKVLWVCNTVARAMARLDQAMLAGLPAEPFHSRYRYKDRLKRQRAVIDGFSPERPAMLAITTQVAEMSLDLSADLLVTEYVSPAGAIQRLGRLNRFETCPKETKTALFLKPPDALPYAKAEDEAQWFEVIETWLDLVADGTPKSQKDLADAFVAVEERVQEADAIQCDWIDNPLITLTNRNSLMEAGYTIDVVRQEDLEDGHLDEMVIPMPFPKSGEWHRWQQKGRYLIAPAGAIDYDEHRGAEYAEEQSGTWII